jgi:hypothetical protein
MWPTGDRTAIDIHISSIPFMDDPDTVFLVAEGIKKADAMLTAARREGLQVVVLALNGNWGWRSTVEGHKVACPDFMNLQLKDHKVYVIPDSDYRTNDQVARGWDECAKFIASKTGDTKTYIAVVPPDGLNKQGADDYLAKGGTLSELLTQAVSPARSKLERGGEEPTPLVIKSGFHLIEESAKGIPHIVAPILPEASIMLVAGHSGTLKTWHMLSLVADLVLGKKWLDHPGFTLGSGPINCLYVNKEMSGIILGQRLKLMMKHERYDADKEATEHALRTRLFTADEAILDLREQLQRDRLEEAIQENNIRMVVLDSFSMCWSGDENSNSEVGTFYNQMRGMIERTGASFLPVHHLDKPQGGRSKHPIMFSIRGAGQLVQQADAALILSKLDPATVEPDSKQIAIVHAKARTSVEMPTFVAQFQEHDGISVSMKYHSEYIESVGKSYEDSKDPAYLDAWIMEYCRTATSMEPTASGMRDKHMISLMISTWAGEKGKPSDTTVKGRLKKLIESGEIELLEASTKQQGNLIRLPGIPPKGDET